MTRTHLSLASIIGDSTEDHSAQWRSPIGIEAPSVARCTEFDIHQACGLLSADIVRRAIVALQGRPEFRLFIHDDRTELQSALRAMRDCYLKGSEGRNADSCSFRERASETIWAAHGGRFVECASTDDWAPVFERVLLAEWRRDVDDYLSALGVRVDAWDSDKSVLRSVERFIQFEDVLQGRQMMRVSSDDASEVLAAGIWYPWQYKGGNYSSFARDVVYQAQKLAEPSIRWQNYWPASSNLYIESVTEVLRVAGENVSRLSFPLRVEAPSSTSSPNGFTVTESIDLLSMVRDEGTATTRLALLRASCGYALPSALSWAHEQLSKFRSARTWSDGSGADDLSGEFLSCDSPLNFAVELIEATRERASFLTNAAFIKDVIGVVI